MYGGWQNLVDPRAAARYFRELALIGEASVHPTRRQQFEMQVSELQKQSLGTLQRQQHASQRNATERERAYATLNVITGYISSLHKWVRSSSSAESAGTVELRKIRAEWERIVRRLALQQPVDQEDFEETLRWVLGRGDVEELDLLRAVRANPPFVSETISRLFERADENICRRVYDAVRVAEEGEQAYQRGRQEWDRRYAGQYIAIHRGQVEDVDSDKRCLMWRLAQKQQATGPFRAYIVQIGAPVFVVRPKDSAMGHQKPLVLDLASNQPATK
jgi:hypothetical protein